MFSWSFLSLLSLDWGLRNEYGRIKTVKFRFQTACDRDRCLTWQKTVPWNVNTDMRFIDPLTSSLAASKLAITWLVLNSGSQPWYCRPPFTFLKWGRRSTKKKCEGENKHNTFNQKLLKALLIVSNIGAYLVWQNQVEIRLSFCLAAFFKVFIFNVYHIIDFTSYSVEY